MRTMFLYITGALLFSLLTAGVLAQDQQNDVIGTTTQDLLDADTDVTVLEDSLKFNRQTYSYDNFGKRDPFASLVPETIDDQNRIKQLFEYEEAKVMGIVSSEVDTYALVNDSVDKSYVLRVGDRVVGGYVTDIKDNEIYMHIVKYGRPMNIVMRMESSRYTVIEESTGMVSIKKPGINLEYESGPLSAKGVIIEDITVPINDIVTIEEEWFGRKDPLYDHIMTNDSNSLDNAGTHVLLIDPQQESWIRLPYIMDWNAPDNIIMFTLVIDDSPSFETPVYVRDDIRTSSFMLNNENELPLNTLLYWKITGVDESGSTYESTPETLSFKITGQ